MSDAGRRSRIAGKKLIAEKAIDELFGDSSVPQFVTRQALEELSDHIDSLLETLPKE